MGTITRYGSNGIGTIYRFVGKLVHWHLKLDKLSCFCLNSLRIQQLQSDFLDIMGQIPNTCNNSSILLNKKQLLRYLDREIIFNLKLTGKSDIFLFLFLGKPGKFCRQNLSTALYNLDLTQSTGTSSPAGRGNKYTFLCEHFQERLPSGNRQFLCAVINVYQDVTVVTDCSIGNHHEQGKKYCYSRDYPYTDE